jgi:hypothetical protein
MNGLSVGISCLAVVLTLPSALLSRRIGGGLLAHWFPPGPGTGVGRLAWGFALMGFAAASLGLAVTLHPSAFAGGPYAWRVFAFAATLGFSPPLGAILVGDSGMGLGGQWRFAKLIFHDALLKDLKELAAHGAAMHTLGALGAWGLMGVPAWWAAAYVVAGAVIAPAGYLLAWAAPVDEMLLGCETSGGRAGNPYDPTTTAELWIGLWHVVAISALIGAIALFPH